MHIAVALLKFHVHVVIIDYKEPSPQIFEDERVLESYVYDMCINRAKGTSLYTMEVIKTECVCIARQRGGSH